MEEVLDISFSVLPVIFLLSGGTLGGDAIFLTTFLGDLLKVLIVYMQMEDNIISGSLLRIKT